MIQFNKRNAEQGFESASSGMMPQLMVLLNGVVISVAAFLIVSSFTGDLSKEEYQSFTSSTAAHIERGVDDMHRSLNTVATLVHMLDDPSQTQTYDRLRRSVEGINAFHEIIWLYQEVSGDSTGRWKFHQIYASEADKTYKPIRLTAEKLRAFLAKSPMRDTTIRLVHPFQADDNPLKADGSTIMAMTKALELGQADQGVLIAVPKLDRVIDSVWTQKNSFLERVSVYDEALAKVIYTEKRAVPSSPFNKPVAGDVLVRAGDNIWTVKIHFLRSPKMLFIAYMPYLAMVFGLSFTAIGVFYVHSHQKKSDEMARMNMTLEYRNRALNKEMETREALNETIQKAERDNRAIIDSVSDIIFETNAQGEIVFLSAAWQKITGFEVEQSLGQDLFAMLSHKQHEENRRDFDAMVRGKKEAYRNYTKLRTADGSFRTVELAVSMTREDDDGDLRVVGTFTDIEERRRAEKALGDAEKKYRTIVENAAGGIYQLTPEGVYLSANPAMARILGYEKSEDLLRSVKNANETIYRDRHARNVFIGTLEAAGQAVNHISEMIRADGESIWVNENARTVRDDQGNVLYFEGSIEDVTDRKRSEQEMEKARIESDLSNRAKSEFLANMSHELRTPLNSIIGFSEIITTQAFGPIEKDEYVEYAKNIHDSGKGLLNVINEILDISKIEGSQRELNERVIDLEKVTLSCLELMDGKINDANIEVQNLLEKPPQIIGDELAMKQIVMNLLSNAVKFTPEEGRISVSCRMNDNGEVHFAISDTGIGMSEEEIEKALSPFAQLDTDLARSGSGTGLGLTLVDLLVKLHGGRLDIISQKGTGTTVTVVLPVNRVTWQDENEGATQTPIQY